MTTRAVTLRIGLSGPDQPGLVAALQEQGLAPAGPPAELLVDGESRGPGSDWARTGADISLRAAWGSGRDVVALDARGVVKVQLERFELDLDTLLPRLARVPFEVVSFGHFFPEWTLQKVRTPGFGDGHWPHGWGCAFRGAGHERLVSDRWLPSGPWRIHSAASQTTLVQFHALGASAGDALEQARPAHDEMGISDRGGYVHPRHSFALPVRSRYLPEERRLEIAIDGRAVSRREMLDAAAAVRLQTLGPERPLASLGFVFASEAAALAHLPDLWRYGLRCSVLRGGVAVRLDGQRERPDFRWGTGD